jgi:hypothetical protein
VSRLLKKGLSSDKFRLFRVIATSPQYMIAASDAVGRIFQGRQWKYLDALRSLTSKALWSKPPLELHDYGATIRLTEYGAQMWRLVQPLLAALKRKQGAFEASRKDELSTKSPATNP